MINGANPTTSTKQTRTIMKKRWMKSVIETSQQDMPALPYQRRARNAGRATPRGRTIRTA